MIEHHNALPMSC